MDDVGIFLAIWSILWSFGIFYGHLVYFMIIWNAVWPFGLFYGHLVYLFFPFSMLYQRKSGNPDSDIYKGPLWLICHPLVCSQCDQKVLGNLHSPVQNHP
jgi:hypothetical protein